MESVSLSEMFKKSKHFQTFKIARFDVTVTLWLKMGKISKF